MSIFSRITLKTLIKNKTRTIVTVIGIILSAAMICAVTTCVTSICDYGLRNMIYISGDWHGCVLDADGKLVDDIMSSEKVDGAAVVRTLGYSKIENPENVDKPYIYIGETNDGFYGMMPVHLTEGRFPEAVDEIILPAHLIQNGGYSASVGMAVTLPVGYRYNSENTILGQRDAYYFKTGEEGETESFAVKEERTYKIVGIYERPDFESYNAPGYTALTLASEENITEGVNGYAFDIFFRMDNAKDTYEFAETLPLSETPSRFDDNSDVLMFLGVSNFDNFYTVMYGLAAIIILLIVLGSVSLIYNAFSISVSERTKQFGLLSSIGATKRQLRSSVFFEALAVSIVGIPLGILSGIAGIAVTFALIGDKFTSLGNFSVEMKLCVSPMSVVIAAVLALVTVFISAWIPSKRAMKVNAIDAIRQNTDISMKKLPKKSGRLTYKVFGLPGVLASKYYRRSRKKYTSTIVSLFMSIVLFVSASAFTGYLTKSVDGGFNSAEYDLRYYSADEEDAKINADSLLAELNAADGVTDGVYYSIKSMHFSAGAEYFNPEYAKYAENGMVEYDALTVFVNNSRFTDYIKSLGLDEKLYSDAEVPRAIAVDGCVSFDRNEQKFVTHNYLAGDQAEYTLKRAKIIDGYVRKYNYENDTYSYVGANDSFTLSAEEAFENVTVRSGKTVKDAPFYIDTSAYDFYLIFPQSAIESVLGKETGERYFVFTSDNHAKSYTAVKEILDTHMLSSYRLRDIAEDVESTRNIVMIINVFSYGFITLISLIAAANVFNTVSTNIALRRREFAMLKSVGMTRGGFNRMMNYECLLYGTRALLYGLPVSIGITYLIYISVSAGFATAFTLPWAAIGIAVFSVFAVVFSTMLYSMRKIKKDNPIDALKNENI